MRRKGSQWTGMDVVLAKEMSDHLHSARMRILEGLIVLAAIGAVYTATQQIKANIGQDPFLLLRLFTTAQAPLPSFVSFLGFLVPIMAIALAFDSINSEHNRGTLSRLLAQPIYRDALLGGKFLSALGTLALALTSLWLLVVGLGLVLLGIPPSGEEVVRGLAFLAVTIFYGGVWTAVAMLFSVLFRQAATSALAALALWLLFTVFWTMVAGLAAQWFTPQHAGELAAAIRQSEIQQWMLRLSPNTLFAEATIGLLSPTTRSLGPLMFTQLEGVVAGAPLPVVQSLLLVWPQVTALIAETILMFTATYVCFQRQEVRA